MARIKVKYEAVDPYYSDQEHYLCRFASVDKDVYLRKDEFVITDSSPGTDWEQRRYEIAKESLIAVMANPSFYEQMLYKYAGQDTSDICQAVAQTAVHFADVLINELKK